MSPTSLRLVASNWPLASIWLLGLCASSICVAIPFLVSVATGPTRAESAQCSDAYGFLTDTSFWPRPAQACPNKKGANQNDPRLHPSPAHSSFRPLLLTRQASAFFTA